MPHVDAIIIGGGHNGLTCAAYLAMAAGSRPPNHKRVYRVMKVHSLLLDRYAGGVERRHDARIAVDERNRRWCSDGFEIGRDNGARVRVAFALDCRDREAMSFLATTGGISCPTTVAATSLAIRADSLATSV